VTARPSSSASPGRRPAQRTVEIVAGWPTPTSLKPGCRESPWRRLQEPDGAAVKIADISIDAVSRDADGSLVCWLLATARRVDLFPTSSSRSSRTVGTRRDPASMIEDRDRGGCGSHAERHQGPALVNLEASRRSSSVRARREGRQRRAGRARRVAATCGSCQGRRPADRAEADLGAAP